VWRDDGSSAARSSGSLLLTPQQVLEADPAYADSPDDLARGVPATPAFEIDFVPVFEAAAGRFSGIEHFVGGAGVTTAVVGAVRAQVTLTADPQGWGLRVGAATDRLRLDGVERLRFADGSLALDLDGAAGEVARLLGAVFGPDAVHNRSYVAIGLAHKDQGLSYEALGALALREAGADTPQRMVDRLWTHVVGSPPTAEQAQPYVDLLLGGMSPGALAVFAAETTLNAERIDLVGLASLGLPYS
jgi:hypothetical protein